MKKLVMFLSSLILGVSLSACGKMDDKKDDGTKDTQNTQTSSNMVQQPQADQARQ